MKAFKEQGLLTGAGHSTIRRRIVNLGLRMISVGRVGTAITVADYKEHRDEFLNPGDRRRHWPILKRQLFSHQPRRYREAAGLGLY